MTAGSAVFQQWPAFVEGAGIDAFKIHVVNIDRAGLAPALSSGKVDAIGGYMGSYVPSFEFRGKQQARILWFADNGVRVVSNGIVAHNDLIKSDPDLLRAFVPASIKGFLTADSTWTKRWPRSLGIRRLQMRRSSSANSKCRETPG